MNKNAAYWESLLKRHPICTKCLKNPHAPNSQWCQPCINARAKLRRKKNPGAWYLRLSEEAYRKRRARGMIYDAIRAGRLSRRRCEVCGARAEAHHHRGYRKEVAFDVRWLCKKHHLEVERLEKERLTTQGAVA